MLMAMAALAMAPEVIRLWNGDAPGAIAHGEKDIPTLTVFKPEKPCGTAVVVCPGGGYWMLADHEGSGYAKYLNRLGITAFVLKYRLASDGYHNPAMSQDVTRAIRTVRTRAADYKIDSNKIGVMGSSAGGHLASTILTHYSAGDGNSVDIVERASSRPDFGILCYAVIDLGEFAHSGSRTNLLGEKPDPALVENLSNQKQVNKNTPPTFIWTTADDATVKAQNSILFAQALQTAGVPYELHVYPHGNHGLGLGGDPSSDNLLPWVTELRRWLTENDWASKN